MMQSLVNNSRKGCREEAKRSFMLPLGPKNALSLSPLDCTRCWPGRSY